MVTVEAEGVFVDLCQPHGIFLDHGELAVIEEDAVRLAEVDEHSFGLDGHHAAFADGTEAHGAVVSLSFSA